MRKRTKLIAIAISILAVLAAVAVITIIKIKESDEYYAHPIYYSYNDKINVVVDGIEYKMGCTLDSNRSEN